jgi:hypothetical protein
MSAQAHRHCPGGLQLVTIAGEQSLHDSPTSGQQHMQLVALRDALTGLCAVGQRVALDERHLLEVVGEHPRS